MAKHRLAIICTHPIQYSAPVFRALARSQLIDLRVFYTWSQAAGGRVFDPGFGTDVLWDIPLLDGYAYQYVQNGAKRPGPDHFNGLDNPTLMEEINAWQPSAVLVYAWSFKSHLNALRRFKGKVPVLFRGDSTIIDERRWWHAMLRRVFLTWVYRHVDVAIAVGRNNRDYFAWCGIPLERVAFAPHSVDTDRFGANSTVNDACAAEWRKELGIDPGAIIVLFAGKLQNKKNPTLLLDAFGSINDRSHLVFVGNGELESELKATADGRKNIHFIPFQNQSTMPSVYRLGDVFVLPSQGPDETWGLALNEAMASGRPVIASSKVGGASDLIRPGENGWIFESGNRKALEGLLRRAIDCGRSVLREMGAAAQAYSSHWSTDESARCICDAVLACITMDLRSRH